MAFGSGVGTGGAGWAMAPPSLKLGGPGPPSFQPLVLNYPEFLTSLDRKIFFYYIKWTGILDDINYFAEYSQHTQLWLLYPLLPNSIIFFQIFNMSYIKNYQMIVPC